MKIINKKTIPLLVITIALSSCSTKGIHEVGTNDSIYLPVDSNNPIDNLAMLIGVPIGLNLMANAAIKNNYKHINSTDALLSALQTPFYKFKYKGKEVWSYLNIVSYYGMYHITHNIFFLIEDKKILNYYTNPEEIPNYTKFTKDENYIDPLKKYRD